jgi:hypothetical protein
MQSRYMEKELSWKETQNEWAGRAPPDMHPRPMGVPKQDFNIAHFDPAPLGADIESEIQKFLWRWHQLPRRVLVPPRYYVRDRAKQLGVDVVEVERIVKLYVGPRPEHENKRRVNKGGRPRRAADSVTGQGSGEGEAGGPGDDRAVPVSGSVVSPTGADSLPGGEDQNLTVGNGGDK